MAQATECRHRPLNHRAGIFYIRYQKLEGHFLYLNSNHLKKSMWINLGARWVQYAKGLPRK